MSFHESNVISQEAQGDPGELYKARCCPCPFDQSALLTCIVPTEDVEKRCETV